MAKLTFPGIWNDVFIDKVLRRRCKRQSAIVAETLTILITQFAQIDDTGLDYKLPNLSCLQTSKLSGRGVALWFRVNIQDVLLLLLLTM